MLSCVCNCNSKDHQKKRLFAEVDLESTLQNTTHVVSEQAFWNVTEFMSGIFSFPTEGIKCSVSVFTYRKLWLDHDNGLQWQSIGRESNTRFFFQLFSKPVQSRKCH